MVPCLVLRQETMRNQVLLSECRLMMHRNVGLIQIFSGSEVK